MNQITLNAIGMDDQQLAEACSQLLYQRDQAARGLGIQVLSVAPGHATLSMRVRDDMLNGHHKCHGGFIFSLADTAFAHACNSYNRPTVTSSSNIDFTAPGFAGDLLTAVAEERQRNGRTGVYDVTVYNQHRQTLAYFRGKSYQVSGTLIAELDEALDRSLLNQPRNTPPYIINDTQKTP